MEHMSVIEDSLKKPESQEEALRIVLSVSTDPQTLKLLEACKNMIRKIIELSVEEKTSNLALQVLINISQNQKISEIMVNNGVFAIHFEYLSKLFPIQLVLTIYSQKHI